MVFTPVISSALITTVEKDYLDCAELGLKLNNLADSVDSLLVNTFVRRNYDIH